MTTPELIQFVKNELASGLDRKTIATKLEAEGWSAGDIIDVFNIIENKPNVATVAPVINKTPKVIFLQSKKKVSSLLLPIIILIFIISGVALAYGSGYFIFPSKLLGESLDTSRNSKASTIDMHIVAESSHVGVETNTDQGFKVIDLAMKGSFDLIDKNNLKSDTSFVLKLDGEEASMDSRIVNGSLYVKLLKAPNLGSISLKPLENQWIVFPRKSSLGDISNNPLISSSGFGSKIVNNLTPEQKQKIYDITSRASLIKMTKKHLPAIVDGSLSYHFNFDLDKEGVASYLKEVLIYLRNTENGKELSLVTDSDYAKIIESLNNFHGEIWIGIFDHIPHKLVVSGDIVDKESKDIEALKISMTMLYSSLDQPSVVEVPEGSIEGKELMSALFGNSKPESDLSIDPKPEITEKKSTKK